MLRCSTALFLMAPLMAACASDTPYFRDARDCHAKAASTELLNFPGTALGSGQVVPIVTGYDANLYDGCMKDRGWSNAVVKAP